MIPLLLIGLGAVSVGATIATLFIEEETSEERHRQQQLVERHNVFRLQEQNKRKEMLSQELENLRKFAMELITPREQAVHEFNSVAKELERQLNEEHFTPARRSAIFLLKQEFERKAEKLQSYLVYAYDYISVLDQCFDVLPAPLETRLPDGYAYHGALQIFSRSELTRISQQRPSQTGRLNFLYDVKSLDNPMLEGLESIPVLVRKSQAGGLGGCIAEGFLRANYLERGLPIPARVTKVRKSFTDVSAFGVKMRLNREDQHDRRRDLLLGTNTSVVPMQYRYDLKPFKIYSRGKDYTRVLVSEREDRGGAESHFPLIPLWIKPHLYEGVLREFAPLQNSRERWLIAPDPEHIESPNVRMQNGSISFWARFEDLKDGACLIYEKPLEPEEQITGASIYAAFASTLVPQQFGGEGSSEEQGLARQDCAAFGCFVAREFERQRHILANNEGGLFYRRWENILKRLVEQRSWGDEFKIDLHDVDSLADGRFGIIPNDTRSLEFWLERQDGCPMIGAFLDGQLIGKLETNEEQKGFFIEPRSFDELTVEHFLGDFSLRPKEFPEAERRQLEALQQFRMGHMENDDVKMYLLSEAAFGKAKEPKLNPIKPINPRIESNQAQREIVQAVLGVPDMFVLQGPPGAGKTTVIIEIILQELRRSPKSRILVTSQSNVAVDNVMQGLAKQIPTNKLLRCASPSKITF